MEESWRRIDSWLAANAPRTFASLRPPASQEAISAAAAELGVEFPADLVAYLRHHDGVSPGKRGYVSPEEGGFSFPGFEPYTLAQIVSSGLSKQETWARYAEDGVVEGPEGLLEGPGGYWHRDFLAFARNISADALVVDCRPGESFGAVGEDAEAEGTIFGEWGSLGAFMKQVADSLESGTAMTVGLSYVPVVDDGMLLWELTPERRPEPRSLFDRGLADPVIAAPRRTTAQTTPNKTWPSGYDNFCLTFAQALDETELLRRFGALPETRRPRWREEAEIPDQRQNPAVLLPVVRVGTHGGWAFGIEEGHHILEGTRDEVLRRMSRGTRAVSVSYWGESGPISVSLFDNGELVTKYNTQWAALQWAVPPDCGRDPFEIFPGLPPYGGQEPTPEQWRERLLAVCDAVVRRCGILLPPPGLDGELDSARILPLLPDNNSGVPVPDRFASLVDAAPPERLRRALAMQMSALAAETGLDTYREVTDALPLLSAEDRPGITDDSALDLRLRRVHAEAQVIYADWNDRSVWQDRAMAARALADALSLPVREALGLVIGCRQDPQWRQEFRKQLTDD